MSERDIFGDDSDEYVPPPPPPKPVAPPPDQPSESSLPKTQPATVTPTPTPAPEPAAEAMTTLGQAELGLLDHHNAGRKVIAVIGFYDSGKTFFVNRLRHNLSDYEDWVVKQSAEREQIIVTPDGILETEIVHEKGHSYVLADVAGESFTRGFNAQHSRDDDNLNINPRYLSIFAVADAFMLLMPAKDIDPRDISEAYERERKEDVTRMIDAFHNITGMVKIAHERMTVGGESARDFIARGVTGAELKDVFHQTGHRCRKPISVLFSLADEYQKYVDDDFDGDPFLTTFQKLPKLGNAVNRFFDYYRFDFLSAFAGQPSTNKPEYRLPHYGAMKSFYWIHELLTLSPMQRRLKGHLPTRAAVKWRRRLDPRFRAQWRRLRS